MTKRLIRYSDTQKAMDEESIIKKASNCSIILKNGKVYTGRILKINADKIFFKNMRLKKFTISTEELSELIIDIKSE